MNFLYIKSIICMLALYSCSEYRYLDKKLKYFENFRNDAIGCFDLRIKYKTTDFEMFNGKDYGFLTNYLGSPNSYFPGDSTHLSCAAYYFGGSYCEYFSIKYSEPLTKNLMDEYSTMGYFFWFKNDTIYRIEGWTH